MKLWLISQDQNSNYDTFDSAVVAAETEEAAARIIPGWAGMVINFWGKDGKLRERRNDDIERWPAWATDLSEVKVKYLGEAAEGIEAGVVLASFNAG